MRIIAGDWRGRALRAPEGKGTRPTSDRAREALFSMLTSRLGSLEGLRVADLFAGTGALGLEALSRGAAYCTFVENDRAAVAALKINVAALDATARADIRAQSALAAAGGPFDLVMLDPPYGTGLGQQALTALAERKGFNPGCLVSIETARDETIAVPGLTPETERTYGKAKLVLLRAL